MKELWSKNKYINLSVNILIFLVAINFMHIGQLFLPIICLILFIDNKFKLKVKDLFSFVVLCLFAITFFIFSYKLGFYSVMGFTLPMAYYIGSNLQKPNKEKVKNLIYLIAFGMACHLILNGLVEIYIYKDRLYMYFSKVSHYDFWVYLVNKGWELYDNDFLELRVKATGTSLNYIFIASCCYYLFVYEKNKTIKIIGIILFVLSSIYAIALARRTTLFLFVISFLCCFTYDLFFIRKVKLNKKIIVNFCLIIFILVLLLLLSYKLNVLNFKNIISSLSIVNRFKEKGLSSGRIEILLNSIKLYPSYLWGGQKISNIVGLQIHDLWGDIYDYAGIIPCTLIVIFTIKNAILLFLSQIKNDDKNIKMLFMSWIICSTIILFLEPIMTGSSLFLILYITICTSIVC